ncbi:hypothetical protein L9G15_27785, partial [Shewanella sp. A3A]|nr:hypothetical protein [Shewanella ferrihydritica]
VQSFDNHKFFHVKEHFHKGPATGSFGGQHVRPLVSLQWQIPCSSVDVQSFDNHKFFHVKEHFHKGPATGSFG